MISVRFSHWIDLEFDVEKLSEVYVRVGEFDVKEENV